MEKYRSIHCRYVIPSGTKFRYRHASSVRRDPGKGKQTHPRNMERARRYIRDDLISMHEA